MVLEDAAAASIDIGFWASVGMWALAIILTLVLVFYVYPHWRRNRALAATKGEQSATPQPRTNPKLRNERW